MKVYVWRLCDAWFCILPPVSSGGFRLWLNQRDATKRRFVKLDGLAPGYWQFMSEELEPLRKKLFSLCHTEGWEIVYEEPPPEYFINNSEESVNAPVSAADASLYIRLHVTPCAPKEVIDAAYKALQRKYHPDRGGDIEKSKEVNKAKEEIYIKRGYK